MRTWWWRVALLLLGVLLVACSLSLLAYSRLSIDREVERDTVPIEVPAPTPTPAARGLDFGAG
jgi:Na+-transporting methylmalonyl-CoA/oxaloacetate decarboxylase gamma subunit